MLDIVSSNKGLLMPRVSLASTSDATTIVNPANSLLVYNTNAGITGTGAACTGFYYNAGNSGSPVWTKLITDGTNWKTTGNADTDSAANFLGTTDARNLTIKTNNSLRMNISATGETTIGNATNHVKIDTIGHLTLEGAATNFGDYCIPPFSTYVSGLNSPAFVPFKDGLQTFTFQDMGTGSEQQVFFSIQMPHNWKEGSTIYPNVHWSAQTSGKTGSVSWGFEYSWANYDSIAPVAFPNATTIYTISEDVSGTDVDKHLVAAFTPITPSATQGKIGNIMMCRLYRNSGASDDTYDAGCAAFLSFDIHYEIDGFGSNSLYAK